MWVCWRVLVWTCGVYVVCVRMYLCICVYVYICVCMCVFVYSCVRRVHMCERVDMCVYLCVRVILHVPFLCICPLRICNFILEYDVHVSERDIKIKAENKIALEKKSCQFSL